MNNCKHDKTHFEPWPDEMDVIEVCDICGMSRSHLDWGPASNWIMVEDIPKVRKQLQDAIDSIMEKRSDKNGNNK